MATRTVQAQKPVRLQVKRPPVNGLAVDSRLVPGQMAGPGPGQLPWLFSSVPTFAPGQFDPPAFKLPSPSAPLPGPIQRKLKVGGDDDPLEHEADQVAERVMRPPHPAGAIAPRGDWSAASMGNMLRRKNAGAGPLRAPQIVHDVLRSTGQPLERQVRAEFEPRFGHSFERVRIHADGRAAESARDLNALAYTAGQHIAFARGFYAPGTVEGRMLLAHELAHTLQQGGGGAGPGDGAVGSAIQRRRVPAVAGLDASLAASGADFDAGREGLARALRRAWDALSAPRQTTVKTNAATFKLSWKDDADLSAQLAAASRDQLLKFAQEIRAADPDLELGDPALIDIGARPGKGDAANITTLVNGANKVFDEIATGARDKDIEDIFGKANVAKAKAKYKNARLQAGILKAANKIVTDRSGYSKEVSLGGLSNSSQISVSPDTIDKPAEKESIVTLIHESMHAGNADVGDHGYIHQPSFEKLEESVKLTNAAHFEVVPRRILVMSFAFTGQTFTPAGGGAAALTPTEQAIRGTSETFRSAWTVGLNLHPMFLRVFKNPGEWNTLDLSTEFDGAPKGVHFADTLPFWSKVEKLTIHARTRINPAAKVPSTNPVTLIDLSLSEGVTRKLAQGMDAVPKDGPAARSFEKLHGTPSEQLTAQLGASFEQTVLTQLILKKVTGEITGSLTRDARVVDRLAQADQAGDFSDYLKARSPADFPD